MLVQASFVAIEVVLAYRESLARREESLREVDEGSKEKAKGAAVEVWVLR